MSINSFLSCLVVAIFCYIGLYVRHKRWVNSYCKKNMCPTCGRIQWDVANCNHRTGGFASKEDFLSR